MNSKKKAGRQAELFARNYLKKHGLILIEQNYYCRKGEIDLIMQDDTHLVFIEVKFRSNESHGSGADAVTYQKQQKIISAARHYLYQNKLTESVCSRFDVISMTLHKRLIKKTYDIQWLKNAFNLN